MDSSIRGTKRFIVDIVGRLPVILCEVDQATGSLEKSYIHADGQILSQVSHGAQSTDVYYYVHDRLGSVRMVVAYDGQTVSVANGYAYRPFGAFYEGECVETVDSPFCFTGQWYDVEIDQYYLRARQYDPAMMRFMTRDPVRGDLAEPMTLHRYLYSVNDPIDRIDPSGQWSYGEIVTVMGTYILAGTGWGALAGAVNVGIQYAMGSIDSWQEALLTIGAFAGMGATIGARTGLTVLAGNPAGAEWFARDVVELFRFAAGYGLYQGAKHNGDKWFGESDVSAPTKLQLRSNMRQVGIAILCDEVNEW